MLACVFIYRDRTKRTVIETDHLNENSILLMQIVYLCRYTRVHIRTHTETELPCFLAPSVTLRNPDGPKSLVCTLGCSEYPGSPVRVLSHHARGASVKMEQDPQLPPREFVCVSSNWAYSREISKDIWWRHFPDHFHYCSFLRDRWNYLDCLLKETNTGNETGWK